MKPVPQGMDRSTFLMLILIGLYVIVVTFMREIDDFTRQFIEMRSEYTAKEQLSKFTLLIVVTLALKSLSVQRDKTLLQLSMAYLVFAMTMYLAESNMIREKLQPLFAGILMPFLLYGLYKKKAVWSALFFFSGLSIITLGVAKDFVVESQTLADALLPSFLELILFFNEEILDMVGIGFIGLSALTLFSFPLQNISKQGRSYSALLCLAVILVAAGNGLLHYQYHPSTYLWLSGFLITLAGTVLFLVSEYLMDNKNKLFQYFPKTNYLFLGVFFMILPSFGTKFTYFTSIVLWFTVISITIIFNRAANTGNIK
jgi:hypothetical protein